MNCTFCYKNLSTLAFVVKKVFAALRNFLSIKAKIKSKPIVSVIKVLIKETKIPANCIYFGNEFGLRFKLKYFCCIFKNCAANTNITM